MTLATTDLDFLCDVVSKRSGNVVTPGQSYLLESRLAPVAVEHGLETVEKLVAELRASAHSKLHDKVAEALTVNETSFFRDMRPFDALREKIVPDLMKLNQTTRRLTIWCAACSSGQEPYTIAIVLREHFPELSNWSVRILATDLSTEMLETARSGKYSQLEVNRGLPARYLIKYFDRAGTQWVAKPEVRQMIDFQQLNLTKAWPSMPRIDVVFIRNVLIYFDPPAKAQILRHVQQVMRPEGYLFIGGAETMIGLDVGFRREEIASCACYRPATK